MHSQHEKLTWVLWITSLPVEMSYMCNCIELLLRKGMRCPRHQKWWLGKSPEICRFPYNPLLLHVELHKLLVVVNPEKRHYYITFSVWPFAQVPFLSIFNFDSSSLINHYIDATMHRLCLKPCQFMTCCDCGTESTGSYTSRENAFVLKWSFLYTPYQNNNRSWNDTVLNKVGGSEHLCGAGCNIQEEKTHTSSILHF